VAALPAPRSATEALPSRQPELIQPAKSLSLTTRQPSSHSVSLSLKDTPEKPAAVAAEGSTPVASSTAPTYALSDKAPDDTTPDNAQQEDRGVALHLSSASHFPMATAQKATSTSRPSQLPQRGSAMQIRIEGE